MNHCLSHVTEDSSKCFFQIAHGVVNTGRFVSHYAVLLRKLALYGLCIGWPSRYWRWGVAGWLPRIFGNGSVAYRCVANRVHSGAAHLSRSFVFDEILR
ncbi:hypothetical protein T4E_5682 [Trichinella pseudospiralis]|uniref:Uncharacterized protein n=1 Tax=Trichinella pseudospiralis TaxID=6337 RepID=A0A0V0Y537_TRIPS|nr:hypothetical protein T4E_5682 [Trichinella pseudospiralis]